MRKADVPLHIDPDWEYFEPDLEVAELLALSGATARFDGVGDDRLSKAQILGIRFGKGNPDHCRFRLAPERLVVRERDCRDARKTCLTCSFVFESDRASRSYCSRLCVPHLGKARVLRDVLCQHCSQSFRPREFGQKFCTRRCSAEARRAVFVRPPTGCENCGGCFPPSQSNNVASVTRRFCSRKCKLAAANRAYRRRRALQKEEATHGS